MATNNVVNIRTPFPIFFGYYAATTGSVTGDGTAFPAAFDTNLFDTTSSLSNGIFTVPTTGRYYMNCTITAQALLSTQTSCILQLGVAGNYLTSGVCNIYAMNASAGASVMVSGLLNLNASDSVQAILTISGGTKTAKIYSGGASNPTSWICGYLLNV